MRHTVWIAYFPVASYLPSTLLWRQLSGSSSRNNNRDDDDYTGRGIILGIVDGGIDYKHPALGGCFGSGCKVAYGYDFVGDDYNGENAPVEDEARWMSVTGIIAARFDRVMGAAPDATIGAYQVFGCTGGSLSRTIIKGLDRAAKDGMDIINLLIGARQFFHTYDDALKVQELVKQGIVVVAAADKSTIASW